VNQTADSILGTVTNDTSDKVSGPIGVSILCFTAKGAIVDFVAGGAFAEKDDLAAGATSSFAADLSGQQCPTYLIGSSGYSF